MDITAWINILSCGGLSGSADRIWCWCLSDKQLGSPVGFDRPNPNTEVHDPGTLTAFSVVQGNNRSHADHGEIMGATGDFH
jgi:hypothetical protein